MKMTVDMPGKETILRKFGLQDKGRVQKAVDSEVMRLMGPYMPRRQTGELEHMMVMGTVVGSGEIKIPGPYAHYLHEGILFVSPSTGRPWAKKGEIKDPTDKELKYNEAPMRGKKFFDRMKADHKDDILRSAQDVANRGGLP